MRRFLHRLSVYFFHVFIARPILLGLAGIRYRKRAPVPEGPCLVVSNHNSHLDAAILMTMFPLERLPHVHPVAAADYFGSSWWRKALAMLFMNGIPIQRRPVGGQDPLAPAIEMLKQGESLVFFPEGSRGKAGIVAPFRRGVGILVREVPGLLVVPVFLSGPERIWPRGEVVPVPMNIDAHVGKPRTYPPTADAREIAEMVRNDVLALAPPPPPVPGRKPQPPTQVVICGIDHEERNAAVRTITERLGHTGKTLGISSTLIEADAAGVREATGPIPVQPLGVWLRLFTWGFRMHRRFRGETFARQVERAQLSEALNHGSELRFAVVGGSALVDLIAFQLALPELEGLDEAGVNRLIQFLLGQKQIPAKANWELVRKAPEVWLINTFDLVRPPLPAVLVVLLASPRQVIERLRSAGVKLQPHENALFFERLQEAYERVGDVLRRLHRVELLVVDGAASEAEAVADRVERLCLRADQAETIS